MLKPSMLCPKANIYYVAGLGGSNPTDFDASFQQTVESIFGLDFEPKLQVLPNKSLSWRIGDENVVATVKDVALKNKDCNFISLVWFCHSQGAQIVCKAYREMQGHQDFPKIKQSSAVVCIGGTDLASNDMAKVVLNVEFSNDKYAKGGSAVLGERGRGKKALIVGPFQGGKCMCCNGGTQRRDADYKDTNKGLSEYSCGISAGFSYALQSWRSGNSTDECAHLISEYARCKTWKRKVRELLPVALGTRCQRHCS